MKRTTEMHQSRPPSPARRLLTALANGLDAARRAVVNVLFVALAVVLLAAALAGGPKVPRRAALVLAPRGPLVEQLSSRSPRDLVSGLAGAGRDETLVRDVVDALAAAKGDERIAAVYMDLDGLGRSSPTKLEAVAAAIRDFRRSGKKVVAAADRYAQGPYYLAAHADEVLMHPDGIVFLEGFGQYRTYYKDAIDRLGITWNVFRVGEYKSAVEPYLRNDMSPEARESSALWLGELWRSYLAGVSAARHKKPEEITAMIEAFPERLEAVHGDSAKLALEEKLVDRLASRDEVRKRMVELVGEDRKTKSFQQVSMADYLEALGDRRPGARGSGGTVAVVVAAGEIVDGSAGPGRVGGDSTAALIRRAREDDAVKAIVLRVDSPGGSAFASEVIRRECELAHDAKKPLVVSMGSVAASGGYWISTAADEIWASPDTITGSIGIFGMFPTVEKPLAKYLGLHVDGVGTTPWSGTLRLDRELPPRAGKAIQSMIDHGYEDFLVRVAKARRMSRDDVDRIARGRVWSGADAKERGLVDRLGTLEEAVASAASKAKLPKGYRVTYVEKERSLKERLLESLSTRAARAASFLGVRWSSAPEPPGAVPAALAAVAGEVERLSVWNDPKGLYAHCLCGVE